MANLIGTAPNQVPTNGSLGTMAFQDADSVSVESIQIANISRNSSEQSSPVEYYGDGNSANFHGKFKKFVRVNTTNETVTLATVDYHYGNNRVFFKVTAMCSCATVDNGYSSVASAIINADENTSSVTTDSIITSIGSATSIFSLAWVGNELQLTTVRPSSYAHYVIEVEWVQSDGNAKVNANTVKNS